MRLWLVIEPTVGVVGLGRDGRATAMVTADAGRYRLDREERRIRSVTVVCVCRP